jgi:hypothetical protein
MIVTLSALALCVWACFSVRLGARTLAEHVDAIGQTPEAVALIEGTRETINPALERARERVLGEYVTAPTYLEPGEPAAVLREEQGESIYAGHSADADARGRAAPAARSVGGPTRAVTSRLPGER